MLKEFPLGDLLLSPMVAFVGLAAVMTVMTRLVLPTAFVQQIAWKRSWLNVALFTCYLALSMQFLGA